MIAPQKLVLGKLKMKFNRNMDRRDMTLQQISLQEYLELKRILDNPTTNVPRTPDTGFGQIIVPFNFLNYREMFDSFDRNRKSRSVCMLDSCKQWVRKSADNIDNVAKKELFRLAQSTGNLIYLCFHNSIAGCNDLSSEIGFRLMPKGNLVSVYTCFPGERRDYSCTWHGPKDSFLEIYGIIDVKDLREMSKAS